MPFCANCGAAVEGKFCPKCGASAPGETPPAGGPAPSQPPAASANALPDNAAAALCYILGVITGILFLTLEPYNRNRDIRFHAWQSIFLFVGCLAIYFAEIVVAWILPWFLMAILWVVMLAVGMGFFVLWLVLMWKAYNGQKWVLPVIGPMAESKA
ncbi:MAG: hypothetical protein HY235_10155 [Acidobacteria bacterium]|nr:hypothetical protein [Acidobacteriota bacterium]